MSLDDWIGNPHDRAVAEELRLLRAIQLDLHHILKLLDCARRVPVRIHFHFKGALPMAQPISKLIGQTVNTSVPVENNAEGQNIPIVVSNLTWSVDDPTVGQLTANPDGSASILGLKEGVCNVTVKDTAFNLTDSGAVTFAADATPTSISFTFS